MIKKVFPLAILLFLSQLSFAQSAKTHWIDSVYQALNANARIGQLMMIPVSGFSDDHDIREIENRIKSHEVGGIVFKNIEPHRQVTLVNQFQKLADTPLLIVLETDYTQRFDSTAAYPPPIVLGAVDNDTLIYRIGFQVANQAKALGVNMLLGLNPVVQTDADSELKKYSFGQDKRNVSTKALALMRGLQDNGVLVCTQNFPMVNLNVKDVHNGLPVIDVEADSVQRYPYEALISQSLAGVSPSVEGYSFQVSKNDSYKRTSYLAAALGAVVTGKWLKNNMDYKGLTLIDLRKIMSSSTKESDPALFSFQMGNDILMYPTDAGATIRKIKKSVRKNDDQKSQLEHSVKKILAAKFDAGLWKKTVLSLDNLKQRIDNPTARLLNQQAYEAAVTVLKNQNGLIPVKILETKSFVYVGSSPEERQGDLFRYLSKYTNISFFNANDQSESQIINGLKPFNTLIIPVFTNTPASVLELLKKISTSLNDIDIIYCDFGNASFLRQTNSYSTIITGYTDSRASQKAVAEIIFGGLPASGTIPYAPSVTVKVGTGIKTKTLQRLTYSIPEDANMDAAIITQIDSIANEAIKIHATPGCQVWVARNGKVIYEKSFGYLTYENEKPVDNETIYDLASVTKVTATLQAGMFMYEHGLIDLHKKVSYYLPDLKHTNKKDITILDMLTHQAGLVPFIPMYPQTIKDTTYLPIYYSRRKDAKYPLQVSSNLFASYTLRDSVWSWVLKSKMSDRPVRTPYSYKYSDLGFLILQRLAETLLNQPLDEFMSQNYYEPLGAYTTGFNPLNRFRNQNIAPTEDDKIYRKSFVSGTVHDERAAMMGGVAGHAGLFSNANDLGKLGQMLLQGGTYGGIQYYKPETLTLFTMKKFKSSRRGIGWDKPIQSDQSSPTSLLASPRTFGHTGFTGTCVWVDPEFNLVYIFLSNRVYPDRNNKLSNANIRTRIQDVIYKSIFSYVDEPKPNYIVDDYAINSGKDRPIE